MTHDIVVVVRFLCCLPSRPSFSQGCEFSVFQIDRDRFSVACTIPEVTQFVHPIRPGVPKLKLGSAVFRLANPCYIVVQ